MAWKKISSVVKYTNRFMQVTEDEVITDYNDKITFGVVHKNPGVSIVPWDGEKFTLISQYRYPVDAVSWEFPAGHFEEHGSVEKAAIAELQEEAGLIAKNIEKIGEFYIAPGHNTQIIHFYLATNLTPVERSLEPAEKGMQVKKLTLQELNHMIATGQIKDSLTIAGLKFFELHSQ